MFTVGVDARELSEFPAGKGHYLSRVLIAMARLYTVRWVLYFQDGMAAEKITQFLSEKSGNSHFEYRIVPGSGLRWHRAVGVQSAREVQVFFAALSYLSAIFNRVPTVSVVHDLAVFKVAGLAHNKRAFWVERFTLKRMVKKSAALLTVSESTAHDLREVVPQSGKKITVTLLAPLLESPGEIVPLEKRKPTILFIGTLEPRKNILAIIRAYAEIAPDLQKKHPLVFIGKQGWGGEDYHGEVEKLGLQENVSFLGYQTDEEMLTASRTSLLFVYPSVYEGFGLPVIEAMAMGTPVVASTTPALREVAGEAALLVDPANVRALTVAIERMLTDAQAWRHMQADGLQRAALFSWEKTATRTYEVLEKACHAQ